MNTHTEEITDDQHLAALKQQIQQCAETAKELSAWIAKHEALLKEKKAMHKQVLRNVKDLIKAEHTFTGRSPLNQTGSIQRGAMNSKLYGHAVEDVSHRQFANNL